MNLMERLPRLEQVINYRDLIGEYPLLLAVRVLASAGLLWMGALWFGFHDPQQSLITEYARGYYPAFDPAAYDYVAGGFLAGFGLYLYTLLLRPWNRLVLFAIVAWMGWYFFGPYVAYQTENYVRYADPWLAQERASLWFGHATMLVFGSSLGLGAYGIWRRRTLPITLSVILAIAIGYLHTGESVQTLEGGVRYGLGFLIYIELSLAALKYEAYVLQFHPAGASGSLLSGGEVGRVRATLASLMGHYGVHLAIMLGLTALLGGIILEINTWVARYTSGRIAESFELDSLYGIVFTAMVAFLLLGVLRMFAGPDYELDES